MTAAKPMQEIDSRAEEHGRLIKEKRLDLGLNRPAFVAQMSKHGQEITPDYLNKLERGAAALSRASLEVREAIRAVLGYDPEEWHEKTGLYTPAAPSGGVSISEPSIKPEWATAFKKRREDKVGSQEELAIQADVSQSLISQIERGVQHPTGVSVDRFARLLTALKWTVAEFSEATGIQVAAPEPEQRRGGPPIKPNLAPAETRVEIPDTLKEAIQKYGDDFPEFKIPGNVRAIASLHRYGGGGEFTANEWLEVLMANRRWLVKN